MKPFHVHLMIEAYLQCAAWSTDVIVGGSEDDFETEPAEKYNFSDQAIVQAEKDCAAFIEAAGDLLDGLDPGLVGDDFWLTREGHGTGFWDRGLGERGDKLTEIARDFGTGELYLGDDGFLHFR